VRVERARLTQDLCDLRTRQVQRVPQLARLMKDINVEKPEKEKLFLPSEYTESARDELKLQALAQVEYTQREGHAYDQIRELCNAIRTLNVNLKTKKDALHGTGANTRGKIIL
ncbi:hypothetical protein B0H17DRAFT_900680, partial [Mycena rosella]